MQEMEETWFQNLGGEETLKEELEPISSILAWEIPWTEEPGGVWPIGLQSQTRLKQLITHAQGGTRV